MIVVVLSGGQDSATCLAWAQWVAPEQTVKAVSFHYGQKHKRELACAARLANMAGVTHDIIQLAPLLGTSPLVSKEALGQYEKPADLPGGVEPTFVPCRNTIFLTYAANFGLAFRKEGEKLYIVTGLCEADYGGYPDCRSGFVQQLRRTLNVSLLGECDMKDEILEITCPLMTLTKKQTVELMRDIGKLSWYEDTHTCYAGQDLPCRKCHACIIRERGFLEAGIKDPLIDSLGLAWPPEWAAEDNAV